MIVCLLLINLNDTKKQKKERKKKGDLTRELLSITIDEHKAIDVEEKRIKGHLLSCLS